MGLMIYDPTIRDTGMGLDGMCQVVLFNDNVNSFDHVIHCLMTVFGHSKAIAEKVAKEAHNQGKTVAEVEDYQNAMLHKSMLASAGVASEVEKI